MKKAAILTLVGMFSAMAGHAQLMEKQNDGNNAQIEILPTRDQKVYQLKPKNGDMQNEKIKVNVYDSRRNLIFSKNIDEPSSAGVSLNFSNLNSGDYLVVVTNGFLKAAREIFVR